MSSRNSHFNYHYYCCSNGYSERITNYYLYRPKFYINGRWRKYLYMECRCYWRRCNSNSFSGSNYNLYCYRNYSRLFKYSYSYCYSKQL